ncbi:MAG: hypothetical protein HY775_12845 [Acidobacteria bacterium]|nr:hypothetical protein [Acidobacteriota bacterium]
MRVRVRDERGATIIFVALALMAIMGMVVMTVDVGALLSTRRRLVRASDAAALAAAQSCAAGDLLLALDAPAQADSIATANVSGAARTAYSEQDCGTRSSGSVTVTYRSDQSMVFAPIIGGARSRTLTATSTAVWGPAGGGRPIPVEFAIEATGVLPCVTQAIGSACAYWWDNSVDHDLANSSNWGLMNLDTWGTTPDASCPAPGASQMRDWIENESASVVLSPVPPTYVCVTSGHQTQTWFDALASRIGGALDYFPINDPPQMVQTSGKEKYAIIGFTTLQIEAVLKGNDPAAVGTAGQAGHCLVSQNFTALLTFDLDAAGCVPGPVDQVANLTVWKKIGNNTITYLPGVDYLYDSGTHVITWLATPVKSVAVEFDWQIAGSGGACGARPPDPNAICLVASYQGAQFGGTAPGLGMDLGVRAIRLAG